MPRDLARELDATPDTPTTTWSPDVGDSLIGRVRAVDHVPSKFSTALQTRLVVEDEETGDLITVFCRHAVLEREIADQQPVVGDRIALKRLPEAPGKPYRRYKVLVEHVAAEYTGPTPDDDFEYPEPDPDKS